MRLHHDKLYAIGISLRESAHQLMLSIHLIVVLLAASVIALIVTKLVRRRELRNSDGGLYGEEDSDVLIVIEILAWVLSGTLSAILIGTLVS